MIAREAKTVDFVAGLLCSLFMAKQGSVPKSPAPPKKGQTKVPPAGGAPSPLQSDGLEVVAGGMRIKTWGVLGVSLVGIAIIVWVAQRHWSQKAGNDSTQIIGNISGGDFSKNKTVIEKVDTVLVILPGAKEPEKLTFEQIRKYLEQHGDKEVPVVQPQSSTSTSGNAILKTFIVPLIPSTESRCSANFSVQPFAGPVGHDNGIIKVDFVNFGEFRDRAMVQTKVDKPLAEDKDRGNRLKDGDSTEIGIGPDGADGFYFAIRQDPNHEWDSEKLLKNHPDAYIRVTILKQPAE